MKLIQRFSEEVYADKEMILSQFNESSGSIIWDEIEQYRSHFEHRIMLCEDVYDIIFCRSVMFELLKCERMLIQCIKKMPDDTSTPIDIWKTIRDCQTTYKNDVSLWLKNACLLLHIQESKKVVDLLLCDLPFVLKAFLCFVGFTSNRKEILHLLTIKEQIESIYETIVSNYDDFMRLFCEKNDTTANFLQFMEQLELKISNRMVLLYGDEFNPNLDSLVELQERYPQLSKQQIDFYVHHRSRSHYYTIQQYMKYCAVCYETARYSLDQLVDLTWYRKQKMGKKFIYFV